MVVNNTLWNVLRRSGLGEKNTASRAQDRTTRCSWGSTALFSFAWYCTASRVSEKPWAENMHTRQAPLGALPLGDKQLDNPRFQVPSETS
eukprot:3444478-Amphidinium_carterae.1